MRRATLPAIVQFMLLVLVPLFPGGTLASASSGDQDRSELGDSFESDMLPLVAIQPLGAMDSSLVAAVARRVVETFAVDVTILPARPVPASAFYRPRSRYRGERLLEWLDANGPDDAAKVIGLLAADISVTKGQVYDWGVIGVAGLSLRAGVVSAHRLGQRSRVADPVERRMTQVTLHELGHTFGLPHCSEPGCIMMDAEGGLAAVDASSGTFCRHCRERLADLLHPAPELYSAR